MFARLIIQLRVLLGVFRKGRGREDSLVVLKERQGSKTKYG